MGATTDLRTSLGQDSLRVRFGSNKKFVTMGDTTVELDATASDEQVAHALNIQKINDIAGPTMSEATPLADTAAKPSEPIKKSITGASFLANLIRTQQAAIKQQLAKAGEDLVAVMAEAQQTADHATDQVKAAKAEVADLKAALGLNSNGDPA